MKKERRSDQPGHHRADRTIGRHEMTQESGRIDLMFSPHIADIVQLLGTRSHDAARVPGPSPYEELVQAIAGHIDGETSAIKEYAALAEHTPDPVVALLVRLVLDDEARHHALLERIAATLADGRSMAHAISALPSAAPVAEADPRATLASVRRFINDERADAHQLRDLARRSHRLDDGLEELLLELMAIDSGKHERIMRFVLQRLERAAHPGD
jgi:rubrerythrin